MSRLDLKVSNDSVVETVEDNTEIPIIEQKTKKSMHTGLTLSYEKYVLAGTEFNLQFERTKEYSNWMNNVSSMCSIAIYPEKIEDVMYVVKHTNVFPSPVRGIGNMHSPSKCITNDSGTSLLMGNFDKIISLEMDRMIVTCQAGVKLSKLHKWLAKQDLEIAFSPEIGDASLGGLVCHSNKDSAYNGNGTLQSIVKKISYVNQDAALVTLSIIERDASLNAMDDLQMFMCSAGLFGIVVTVTLEVRKRAKILTTFSGVATKSKLLMPTVMNRLRKHNNVFMFVSPRNNTCLFEGRDADQPFTFKTMINVTTLMISQKIKYYTFLNAKLSLLSQIVKISSLKARSYRSEYVNDYPTYIPAHKPRLTFFLLEFDFNHFEFILTDLLKFHKAYKEKHGFEPEGYAIYFVTRTGLKPTGNFSGPAGVSFCCDPVYHKPNDPKWIAYQSELILWGKTHNAKLSLNQSGDPPLGCGAEISLPRSFKSTRFANPWIEKYVTWTE